MRPSTLLLIILATACGSEKDSAQETGNLTTDTATTEDSATTTTTEDTYVTPDPECGNGIVEDGEECDDPDSEDNCLDDCTLRIGNCHTETPWDQIAESLYEHDINGLLPTLPDTITEMDFTQPTPEFVLHNILPFERWPDDEVPSTTCETPIFWDSDTLEIGPFVEPDSEELPYCRVRPSDTKTD